MQCCESVSDSGGDGAVQGWTALVAVERYSVTVAVVMWVMRAGGDVVPVQAGLCWCFNCDDAVVIDSGRTSGALR